MQQVEMICLEDLVPEGHNYRKFAKIWSFNFVEKKLKKLENGDINILVDLVKLYFNKDLFKIVAL